MSLTRANYRRTIGTVITGLTCLAPVPFAVASGAGSVYWSDALFGTIERAGLDGGNREVVLSGLEYPEGLVVDGAADQLYWIEGASQLIRRSHLDGSGAETLVGDIGVAAALGLDKAAGKLYWTNVAVGTIWRANLDGSSVEQIGAREGHTRGLAIDSEGGKLYISGGGNQRVEKSNLDGTEIEVLMSGVSSPIDVALDLESSRVYVASGGGVFRSDLSGGNFEQVLTLPTSGLALDVIGGRIYGSSLGGPIWSATLDGDDVQILLTEDIELARHLELGLSDVASLPGLTTEPTLIVSASPNPFGPRLQLNFAGSGASPVIAVIHDVHGRRVKTLEAAPSLAGTLDWDGRDEEGRELPSGVYPYVLSAGPIATSGRVVRVR